jgi:outer membrane protein OmpA-like peptidoglycan-associated protein
MGHASTLEKNHELLSLYRAQLVGEALIAKGINRQRIQAKGWGNHKLLIRDETIKKAKTCDEKMALHIKNQRVVFKIVSWDFKE